MPPRAVHIIDAACDADALLEALLLAEGQALLCSGSPPPEAPPAAVLPLNSPRGRASEAFAGLRDGSVARCWSISAALAAAELRGRSAGTLAVRMCSPPSADEVRRLHQLRRGCRVWAVCADRALTGALESAGLAEVVRVIPPPAAAGDLRHRSAARKRLGLGPDEFVVAAPACVHARSGHRFAAWAAAVLCVADVPIRMIVPHTGQAARDAVRFGADAGFGDHVLLARRDRAADLGEILSGADAALLLNVNALPPVPLAAAMRTGLPIVASDIPAAAAWLENERTALLAAPDLPRAISQALLRLYEDRDLAARLGQAAKASAGDRFDPPAVRRQWDDLAG